jgi:hypothetical protein
LYNFDLSLDLGGEPGWVTNDDAYRLVGGKKIFDDL